MSSDINDMIAAEEATREDHIYLVIFEVLSRVEGFDHDGWIEDELSVGSGEDGERAIAKAKEHVASPEYHVEARGFRLKGLRLLAVAEI
jgi:hypothetical protein